ncbi:ATM interactor-like [Gigantopelta aegis]|uniref:ATM interactor-like n=1 Tax=Gigantopelta aegis TaxID=1735272 RepID=UPI001B8883B7|nr:ATM interactor-like [Gigantopelta aegis]XP_041377153.1 ATM interactor-like [Gigantopelta aegis]
MKTSNLKFEKICPNVEELSAAPKTNVSCPLSGCNKLFYSTATLRLHKAKVHGIDKLYLEAKSKDITYQYHCPAKGCMYNPDSDRHFSTLKLLKQHYRKLHLEKKFFCTKCQKGFGVNCDKERHEKTCGTVYHCPTCDCVYTTKEALLTHCRRQKHTKPTWEESESTNKTRSKKPAPSVGGGPVLIIVQNSSPPSSSSSTNPALLNCRPVLPKPVVHTLPPLRNLTIGPDKISYETISDRMDTVRQVAGTQTDIYGVDHLCVNGAETEPTLLTNIGTQVGVCSLPLDHLSIARPSAEVQTSLSIRHDRQKFCSVAETQTSGDSILRSAMESAEIPVHSHKQMATQYMPLDFKQFRSSEVQINLVSKRKLKRKQPGMSRDVLGNVYSPSTSDNLFESMVGDMGSSISTQTRQSFLETFVACRNEQLQSCQTQTNLSLFKNSGHVVSQRQGSAAKRKSTPHRLTHSKRRKPAPSSVGTSVSPHGKNYPATLYQNVTDCTGSNPLNQQMSPSSPQTLFSSPSKKTHVGRFDAIGKRKKHDAFCDDDFYVDGGPTTSRESGRDLCSLSPPHTVIRITNETENSTNYVMINLTSEDPTNYAVIKQTSEDPTNYSVINQTSEDCTNYAVTGAFEEIDNLSRPDFLDLADHLAVGPGSSVSAACQTLSLDNSFSKHTMTQGTPQKPSGTQTTADEDALHKQCSVGVSAFIPSSDMCTQTTESASARKDLFIQTVGSASMSQSVSVCLSLSEPTHPAVDTIESSVQTLTSSTDLDQLVRSEIQKSMLKQTSGTEDIHTQTADELLDFLMMNMETQTTDDLFCGFSETETQTNSLDTRTVSLSNTWLSSEKPADGQTNFSSAGNRMTVQEMVSAREIASTPDFASGQDGESAKNSATPAAAASTDEAWAGPEGNGKAECRDNPWLYSPVSAQTQTSCSGLWLNCVTAAAETQTTLIQPLLDLSDDDMTLCMDMETQTHFSIVDEGIGDLTDSHTQTTFQDLTSLFSP